MWNEVVFLSLSHGTVGTWVKVKALKGKRIEEQNKLDPLLLKWNKCIIVSYSRPLDFGAACSGASRQGIRDVGKKMNKAGYTATSCRRVGRGGNARFPTFQFERDGQTSKWTDGPMDRRTDKASYRVACPQLKRIKNVILTIDLSVGRSIVF